ncbi:unnamed protein product [Prunus armeniaca]|uniref:Uncharacterized protein n=1 Tax=Prunus armeniaca TaxID=36596 RepID=A0A6J5V615_PRUAR|nr:unnamed protein product [Prunus armeniaca]CAB4313927.1 unnamed protein product [Prunus armeniaca]
MSYFKHPSSIYPTKHFKHLFHIKQTASSIYSLLSKTLQAPVRIKQTISNIYSMSSKPLLAPTPCQEKHFKHLLQAFKHPSSIYPPCQLFEQNSTRGIFTS